jgi:transcriptional regulator with XRE-family HTH domain
VASYSKVERQYLKKLGENIRRVRKRKGFSQDRLCLEGSISRRTIWKIETGALNPSALTLRKIARTIGVGPDELLAFKA